MAGPFQAPDIPSERVRRDEDELRRLLDEAERTIAVLQGLLADPIQVIIIDENGDGKPASIVLTPGIPATN